MSLNCTYYTARWLSIVCTDNASRPSIEIGIYPLLSYTSFASGKLFKSCCLLSGNILPHITGHLSKSSSEQQNYLSSPCTSSVSGIFILIILQCSSNHMMLDGMMTISWNGPLSITILCTHCFRYSLTFCIGIIWNVFTHFEGCDSLLCATQLSETENWFQKYPSSNLIKHAYVQIIIALGHFDTNICILIKSDVFILHINWHSWLHCQMHNIK